MASIPLHLVTGFLGSGKTTFLKVYLRKFSGNRKIGVIQNDFAAANIDSRELMQANPRYEILEVNNGSVFCVCLLGSFIHALADFVDSVQPEELILEASGLADPLSIGQILQAPPLRHRVYLGQCWCLVDAVNHDKIAQFQTTVNHQIRIADTVIVNKIDRVGGNYDAVAQLIQKTNPAAKILAASYAEIEFEQATPVLKFLGTQAQPSVKRPGLESQVVKSTRLIAPENFELFLEIVRKVCVRIKGFVNLDSGRQIMIQESFGESVFQEINFSAPTEFVLIGQFDSGFSGQKLFDTYCIK